MKPTNAILNLILIGALSAGLSGCDNGSAKTDGKTKTKGGHSHSDKGPHKGDLVDLGKDGKYHAEIVHDDDTDIVTVYILAGDSKTPVPIDAKQIAVNLTHDGVAEPPFKLNAKPDAKDPQGKSSRFVTPDKELGEHLDLKDVTNRRLVVKIDGKDRSGEIKHSP